MIDVAVVDYGMGNLRSVAKALEHVAPEKTVKVTDRADDLRNAARVVFPGVGAMGDCMRELDARGLRDALLAVSADRPFLGICLGMQALFEASEEGGVEGLGILPGRIVRFPRDLRDASGVRLKVPHMGWNEVRQQAHPLWNGIQQDARFYFVHSYYLETPDADLVAATSAYPAPFACAVARDHLFAVQFHPEKSQAAGLKLLANFMGTPA